MKAPPFYPRTKNRPLVSILIPTRGRSEHLKAAVDSCYSLAKDKKCMEFIFKTDTDDRQSRETVLWLRELLEPTGIRCQNLISDRGNGYFDMHHWVNQMAAMSKGDWIFLFNDDARITTQNWDDSLLLMGSPNPWIGIQDVTLMIAPTVGRPFAQEFFFLRRKVFEILGHISFSPHNDNWIHTVMSFLGCEITSNNIHIEHMSGIIGDQTRKESEAAYKTTIQSIVSLDARRAMFKDVGVLLNWLGSKEVGSQWFRIPEHLGWYIHKDEDNTLSAVLLSPNRKIYFPNIDKPARVEDLPYRGQFTPINLVEKFEE